jgi:hypothetical protein
VSIGEDSAKSEDLIAGEDWLVIGLPFLGKRRAGREQMKPRRSAGLHLTNVRRLACA